MTLHNTSIPDSRTLADGTIRHRQTGLRNKRTGRIQARSGRLTDRGDSWRPLSKLQGIVPNEALAPFGAKSANATTDRPLYLSAGSYILSRRAVSQSRRRSWTIAIGPICRRFLSRARATDHIGITNILGVTASGKLLAFGVNPQTGVQTDKPLEEQFDQQWLWSWDPHAARWTSLAPPLPVDGKVQRRLLAGITRSERDEPADHPMGTRIRLREQR